LPDFIVEQPADDNNRVGLHWHSKSLLQRMVTWISWRSAAQPHSRHPGRKAWRLPYTRAMEYRGEAPKEAMPNQILKLAGLLK
jgi:hypothetical protein